jgi:cytochrome c oxidase assembly factor CtaG
MLETVHMIEMYVLGFAVVWLAILAVCCVVGIVGRRRHNWDRALGRELLVAAAKRELPAPTPGHLTD